MKRVIVVGSGGQDGRILREQLQGAPLALVDVDSPVNVLDAESVGHLMKHFRPDEVYYLAAYHHSAEAEQEEMLPLLRASLDVHILGWANVLESARVNVPACRLFYASSSHVFGHPKTSVQDESTPRLPTGAYGITKQGGMGVAALFRQRGLFVSCGILYNHESRYRPVGFLSQKIATAARNRGRIRIGRLDATVDWGWADDTVRAMRAILAADAPDDFVVATGVPHTVRDFVDVVFRAVGLDWRDYVEEDERVLHKEQATLIGNATKLRTVTGWKPSVSFEEMVARLVSGDA